MTIVKEFCLGTCYVLIMGINATFSENCVDNKSEELEIKLEGSKYESLQKFCLQFAIRA